MSKFLASVGISSYPLVGKNPADIFIYMYYNIYNKYDIYIHNIIYIYIYNILYVYIYIYILYMTETNFRSDIKISKMFPTKPNQMVPFLFPNLSNSFLPGSS